MLTQDSDDLLLTTLLSVAYVYMLDSGYVRWTGVVVITSRLRGKLSMSLFQVSTVHIVYGCLCFLGCRGSWVVLLDGM